ncbi:Permuted single zf-CXXC unit [Arabidopsis thaliana x Arabidopsis arenosa]|uniref:Permuted single zf-CXXC unit n=1 Tax=Arabidopsis thaliana x Arabidopsis arenosa TaxID=1240361 RepID=A0A8T1YE02_9BRAS|nr:Permuted single zf-CXXC unit [Arabidopsis thaliana x Arabidopsis arenosa]
MKRLKKYEFERPEPEDLVPYLLAIWTPGENVNSIQPPKQRCAFLEKNNTLCHEKKCFQCNKIREVESQTVRGTILVRFSWTIFKRISLSSNVPCTNIVPRTVCDSFSRVVIRVKRLYQERVRCRVQNFWLAGV